MAKHNLAKSTLWLIISEIIFNLSGYIIHSMVARILGPSDYGRYGLVVTMTTMIIILIGNGVPTAMAKYISEIFEKDSAMVLAIKKQAVLLQMAIVGAITVLFFLLSPLLAKALGDPSLTGLFRISTLIIPAFAAASFYFSYYTGLHKFNLQSTLKVTRSILKVFAIVGLAWAFGVPGSILGYALAAFGVFLIGFAYDQVKVTRDIKRAAKAQKLSREAYFPAKKLLNYAWQVIIFFLAYELLISIDLYLVKGILHDDYLTGIYNASLTVGRIPYYIFYALTIMLLPVVSKSTAENDHQKTANIISHSLRLMLLLLVPSVILLSLYSEQAISIFYSKKYLAAAYPMSILAYGVGFLTIFYVFSFILNGAGKTLTSMNISIFGFILNATLNFWLIKKYGLTGSAIATSIASAVSMLIMLFYGIRYFGKIIDFKSLAKIILAGAFFYPLKNFLPNGKFSFIFSALMLLSVYFVFLYAIKEITKADLAYLKDLVSKKGRQAELQEELSGNEPNA